MAFISKYCGCESVSFPYSFWKILDYWLCCCWWSFSSWRCASGECMRCWSLAAHFILETHICIKNVLIGFLLVFVIEFMEFVGTEWVLCFFGKCYPIWWKEKVKTETKQNTIFDILFIYIFHECFRMHQTGKVESWRSIRLSAGLELIKSSKSFYYAIHWAEYKDWFLPYSP